MLAHRIFRAGKSFSYHFPSFATPLISSEICLGTLSLSPRFKNSVVASGCGFRTPLLIKNMSISISSSAVKNNANGELLSGDNDLHSGVTVKLNDPMDSSVFSSMLKASLSHWRQQGKRGIWVKLPIELANLVEPAVKEGFKYHHAESDYLMLVYWIPETANVLPANASHRVGIGAFVINDKREVLVVQEKNGRFKNTGIWKLPTGVVNEGEDICEAAVREVKEETGIDTEFLEVLAFRQSHQSFHSKSDLMFVCMLKPCSFDIVEQDSEIEAAQWMPAEKYAAQEFVKKHQLFNYIAQLCLTKSDKNYTGFTPLPTTASSGKVTYLYANNRDFEPSD